MKTIILTGGGTGGHVYPNIAMLDQIKNYFDKIYYFGVGGIDEELAKKSGLPFFKTDYVKFDRKHLFKNATILYKLNSAKKKVMEQIYGLKPDVVLSKGGYAALPTSIAALDMNVPVICHESDVTLGLANRYAKFKGATMAYADKESALKYKGEFTGIPLRQDLFKISKFDARSKLNVNKTLVLVIGGSSGATAINEIAKSLPDKLGKNFFIVHICGKGKADGTVGENYLQLEYTHDMPLYMNAADIIISRCGATSLHEIAALKKKAVFIPLPKGISRGDQILNAEIAKKHGGTVLYQNDLSLLNLTNSILNADKRMTPICENPNEKLLSLILKAAKIVR
ncbi:MAG: UDP-N-acetylglucosamine--N-acetylmuramyl-(pentapeptide) pyrophosphoryl-undecaprenol N-acetylglucosamine transferase [Christensenellales bacterium]